LEKFGLIEKPTSKTTLKRKAVNFRDFVGRIGKNKNKSNLDIVYIYI